MAEGADGGEVSVIKKRKSVNSYGRGRGKKPREKNELSCQCAVGQRKEEKVLLPRLDSNWRKRERDIRAQKVETTKITLRSIKTSRKDRRSWQREERKEAQQPKICAKYKAAKTQKSKKGVHENLRTPLRKIVIRKEKSTRVGVGFRIRRAHYRQEKRSAHQSYLLRPSKKNDGGRKERRKRIGNVKREPREEKVRWREGKNPARPAGSTENKCIERPCADFRGPRGEHCRA